MDTSSHEHPTPIYRLSVDGQDVSTRVQGRLESLTLTDNRGFESDQLDIVLDDSDGRLDIPPRGATVTLALGWQHIGLVEKGTFTVDEVEHAGAPDKLTLRARSADLRVGLSTKRERSWHNRTVGDIVRRIATQHGLTPVVGADLAGEQLGHIDQTAESDTNLLTRIAQMCDAVATVKADRLIFCRAGRALSASGTPLEQVTIERGLGDSHRFSVADREVFTGVRAYYQDTAGAKKGEVLVGAEEGPNTDKNEKGNPLAASADNVKTLRHTYASRANAQRAAKSAWAAIQRGKAQFSITLALARPELFPEVPVRVRGFKPVIDAASWILVRVTHTLGDGGFTTALELETKLTDE